MIIKLHFLCLKGKVMFDSEKEAGCKGVGKKLPIFFLNIVLVCGMLTAFGSRKEGFKSPLSPVVFVIVASLYSSFQIISN